MLPPVFATPPLAGAPPVVEDPPPPGDMPPLPEVAEEPPASVPPPAASSGSTGSLELQPTDPADAAARITVRLTLQRAVMIGLLCRASVLAWDTDHTTGR
jgi:hypothetical protein